LGDIQPGGINANGYQNQHGRQADFLKRRYSKVGRGGIEQTSQ
jgi:hypothetical protein